MTAAIDSDLSPDDEWYVANVLPWRQGGRIAISHTTGRGHWADVVTRTPQEALGIIRSLDADPRVKGVFASQGLMRPHLRKKRDADLAEAFRSVWLDLDGKDFEIAGEDLPSTFQRILTRLKDFSKEVGLPSPSVMVWSGGGIHAYWLFEQPISKEHWKPIAQGLRACAEQLGLPADLQCTTDAARVLRIPGTQNRKPEYGEPQPVEVIFPANKTSPLGHKPSELLTALSKFVGPKPATSNNVIHLSGFEPRPSLTGQTELAAGLDFDIEEVRSAMAAISPSEITSEGDWMRIARALAHQAFVYPHRAEELWAILDQASRCAPKYDEKENRRRWERYISEAPQREDPITIATLFAEARAAGWQGRRRILTMVTPQGNSGTGASSCGNSHNADGNGQGGKASASPPGRQRLNGGTYDARTALALLNSHFFIALVNGATPIAQILEDGSIQYLAPKDFSMLLRNVFVDTGATRPIRAEKFWLEHPHRHQRKVIFSANGVAQPHEYNLWRGFGVKPTRGWSKQLRLLRHIRQVLCCGDKTYFRYLMKWLAWGVQNPDQRPETVVVLKSRVQGTGKTTLSDVMRRIFGSHARVISSKARLLSRFNADFETACWISGEEMLWAGDKGGADALKSLITGDALTLEVKNGARWEVPNRLHILMTTNHEHAVAAGNKDRRYLVLEVGEEKAQQREWFEPLYADLDNGGREQFLWLLLNLKLGTWHPRHLPRTTATIEQQRMSADSVAQWASACCEADAIAGQQWTLADLGTTVETHKLRQSYAGYCQQHQLRCVDDRSFGKALRRMFGKDARKRLYPPTRPALPGSPATTAPRPYGWEIPDGDNWRKAIDEYLGI